MNSLLRAGALISRTDFFYYHTAPGQVQTVIIDRLVSSTDTQFHSGITPPIHYQISAGGGLLAGRPRSLYYVTAWVQLTT